MTPIQAGALTSGPHRPQFGRQVSIFIAETPDLVFRYVIDMRRHAEWSAEPLEIRLEPGPEHGPGTHFTSTAGVGRRRITGRGRIIAEEPPTRFVYESTDLFGCHRWTMTLQAQGTGTRLTQRIERLAGPLWVRLLQPLLLWPLAGHRSVKKGLATLKVRLEAGEAGPTLEREKEAFRPDDNDSFQRSQGVGWCLCLDKGSICTLGSTSEG